MDFGLSSRQEKFSGEEFLSFCTIFLSSRQGNPQVYWVASFLSAYPYPKRLNSCFVQF